MANNDIKQKIVLEGEKQYRDAIKDAQRNLKTLRSELKAETAELGNNATAQQKNEAKVKSLKKQIAEQEKLVKANSEALEEVKQKYGDNADAVAKYEQKLNDSRTALANMKNELGSVGQSMQTVQNNAEMATVATKSIADAMKSVGDAAGSISGALESAFNDVLSTLHDAVSALWDEIMATAAKANAWTDLADYFGSTAGEVQQWSNAIQGAGGSFDNFTSILNKFKTGGVNKKIAELFGVSDENYTNDLEYTAAVLDSMAKKREEMTKNGTWDSALADIFGGRKSQAAGWFISNWEQIQENLSRYDAENGGVGMTDEELKTMNQLYIDVENIKTTWAAFKSSFLAGAFGKLSLDLAGNAQGILDGLIAFMNADNKADRDKAIEDIQTNMEDFFRKLGEAIEAAAKVLDEVGTELAGSENGYVAMIGKALQALSDVLEWLTKPESLEQVKKFFEMLIGIWAGAKVTTAVGNIASFAANLLTIKSGGGLISMLFGNGGGGTTGGGGVTPTGTAAAAPTWFTRALQNAANYAPAAQLWASNGAPIFDWLAHNTGLGQELILGTKEKGSTFSEIGDNAVQWWNDYKNVLTNSRDYFQMIGEWLQEAAKYAEEHGDDVPEVPTYTGPDENGYYPDWYSITDIMEDMERRRNESNNGGNSGNTDGLTSGDAKNMTDAMAKMPGEVRKGMIGMKVVMDRTIVGQMVADEVSRQIAAQIS